MVSMPDYQPQQSVLNRHAGHRHTACMRNISVPQRSQRTLSPPVKAQDGDVAARLDRMGWAR
jgi:hypothetical protein